jgi:hypothetical protein
MRAQKHEIVCDTCKHQRLCSACSQQIQLSSFVYQRSRPLATRNLRMVRSQLGDRAGITGAAVMVIEDLLSPLSVDRALQAGASDAGAPA